MGEDGVFTISPTASTVACNASSLSVTLYWNGAVLKADGVTYDFDTTEGVSSVSYNKNTGVATVNYGKNESLSDPRQMTVTFTYKNQNVSILITQNSNYIKIYDWNQLILIDASGVTGYANIVYADGYSRYTGEGVSVSTSNSWITCSWDSTSKTIVIIPTTNNGSQNRVGTVNVKVTLDGIQYLNSNVEVYQYKVGYHESLPQMGGVTCLKVNDLYWSIKNINAHSTVYDGSIFQWGAGATSFDCNVNQYDTNDTTLPSSADTATQVLGSKWRTPTRQEMGGMWTNYNCLRYYTADQSGENYGTIYFNETTKDILYLPVAHGRRYEGSSCNSENDYGYWTSTPTFSTAAYAYSVRLDSTAELSKRCGYHIRGVYPVIQLSPYSASVQAFSGETSFDVLFDGVVYDGNITITPSDTWLSATNNNGTITVTYQQNSSGDDRVGRITVIALGQTATFEIAQEYADIITSLPYDGVYNGHKYIKIGGINWAVNEVGAPSDGRAGNMYQWGAGASTATLPEPEVYYSGTTVFPVSCDTATQVMGQGWRMPRYSDFNTQFPVYYSRTAYYYDGNELIEGQRVWYLNEDRNTRFIFISSGYIEGGHSCRKAKINNFSTCSYDYWLASWNSASSSYASQYADCINLGGASNGAIIGSRERTQKNLINVRGIFPTIKLSEYNETVDAISGTTSFYVLFDNERYYGSVTATSSDNWVSASYNSGTITLTYGVNNSGDERDATITVTALGQTATFTLTQNYCTVITSLPYDGVANGYKYIEIKGLKWSINDVGAPSDGRVGDMFQWGAGASTATLPYPQYYHSGTTSLSASEDTATQVLGNGWRMPTYSEMRNANYTSKCAYYYDGSTYIKGIIVYHSSNPSKYMFVSNACTEKGCDRVRFNGSYYSYAYFWLSTCQHTTGTYQKNYGDFVSFDRGISSINSADRTYNYLFTVRGIYT